MLGKYNKNSERGIVGHTTQFYIVFSRGILKMKSNNLKKITALAAASSERVGKSVFANTNFDTIKGSEVIIVGDNLALKKHTESSCVEKDILGAYNVTSGEFDRKNLQERWSSEYDAVNPWVTIDLGEITEFNEVVIEWERRNVTSYEIQGSNDKNNWAVIKKLGRPKKLREAVEFEDQEFRYVKLQIKTYGEDGVVGEIPWLIVSIYEIEVYRNRRVETPERKIIEFNNFVLEKSKVRQVEKEARTKWARVVKAGDNELNVDLGQVVVVGAPLVKGDKIFSERDKHRFLNSEGREKRACAGGKSPPHLAW